MMWYIPQKSKTIFALFTSLCLMLCFAAGCKDDAPQEKPQVVVKRIEKTPEEALPEKTAALEEETPQPTIPEKTAEIQTEPQLETVKDEPAEALDKIAKSPEKPIVDISRSVEAKPAVPTPPESVPADGQEAETEPVSLKSSLSDASPRYDPVGKIDPFAALFSEESGETSEDTEPKRPLTPLEKIDLSQLKLVAVLQAQSGNKAMVEDATGKGYVVIPGTFIGINSGRVTEILRDRILVEEKAKDFLGKVRTDTKELKLQKPFGEE